MTANTVAGGRYLIEDTLGHGGMAVVYLARDAELDRPVALKVLAENLGGDGEVRERFVREARLAARLSHPNVVHVFDAGEDDGRPFIVMEYVPGETLARVLERRRKLPSPEAAALAAQAARGLQHAHSAELVHRDVKPQNLLLRDDGVLKIADFGIARALGSSRLTQLGTVLGTASYIAPEQALGEEVGPPADIYSLGAVLYQLLTGQPPYEVESLAELAEQHRSGTIVPVRDLERSVPSDIEAVVMRCLARDPTFRPSSADELVNALAAEPATTVKTVALPKSRPPRRTTWRWIAIAALFGVVVLVLGLLRLGDNGSSPTKPAPPRVQPIAPGATAADEARNLSRWLRANARR